MIRGLFKFASVMLLVAAVAAVAIWPRTLKVADTLTYLTASDTAYSFGTAPGHLTLVVSRDVPPMAPEFEDDGFPQPSHGWTWSTARWGTRSRTFSLPSPPPTQTSGGTAVFSGAVNFRREWFPPAHRFLGIGWESSAYPLGPPIYTRSANVVSARWVVPLWLILAVAAVLPAAWLAGRLRARRRRRQGQCVACGYDLRASNDHYPECGTPFPQKAPA